MDSQPNGGTELGPSGMGTGNGFPGALGRRRDPAVLRQPGIRCASACRETADIESLAAELELLVREVFVNRVAHYPGSGYFLVLGHADYGFVTLLGKRYGDTRRFRRVGAGILARSAFQTCVRMHRGDAGPSVSAYRGARPRRCTACGASPGFGG